MDEEDGRPGPGAWQFGPNDVHTDALAGSLCRPHPFLTNSIRVKLPIAAARGKGKTSHPQGEAL
jgi:hypothetical protein